MKRKKKRNVSQEDGDRQKKNNEVNDKKWCEALLCKEFGSHLSVFLQLSDLTEKFNLGLKLKTSARKLKEIFHIFS